MHVAAGKDFLHWRSKRPAKVLYVDGEMSRRLLLARLRDAKRRLGFWPSNFRAMSKEDFENMPPLNTRAGQKWMEKRIKKLGGFDLIIFDNLMSLLLGNMKETDTWESTIPWVRYLTRRDIAQIWIHHTGIDQTRGYGDSTKTWQLDTEIQLIPVENPEIDISFQLTYPKARERGPHNRSDFAEVLVTLENDAWQYKRTEPAQTQKGPALRSNQKLVYDALRELVCTEPVQPQPEGVPPDVDVVCVERLKAVAGERHQSWKSDPKNTKTSIREVVTALADKGYIMCRVGYVWLPIAAL